MSAELVPLDETEWEDLARCEAVIKSGLQTFVEVGTALAEIRDQNLYRQTHLTFEAYCESEWQLSRTRAYELMGAAEIVTAVSAFADTPVPANEAQARPLAGLEPEVAAEVMQAAAEAGPVTAKSVAAAREQVSPKPVVAKRTETTKTEYGIDMNTGEVTDAPVPTPQAVAKAARAEAKSSPWAVFSTEILPELDRCRTWAENKGLDLIVADRSTWGLTGAADDYQRASAALDRLDVFVQAMRDAIQKQNRPLRSVRNES